MGIDELVREELVVLVGELRPELDGAAVGVDLVVQGEQIPGGQLPALLPVIGLHRQVGLHPEPVQQLRQIILRDGENHRDGLDLGDHRQPGGIGGVDDVARVHQAQPDAAADGRGDLGVDQLQLGVVDLPLV